MKKLTVEELNEIRQAQANLEYLKVFHQKAESEHLSGQLVLQNIVLKLKVKYGLDMNTGWDNDGNIVEEKKQQTKEETVK